MLHFEEHTVQDRDIRHHLIIVEVGILDHLLHTTVDRGGIPVHRAQGGDLQGHSDLLGAEGLQDVLAVAGNEKILF